MNALIGGLVKFLTWIGTTFLIRKGGKDSARAESAEKTLEVVRDINRPASDAERDELRARYRRD